MISCKHCKYEKECDYHKEVIAPLKKLFEEGPKDLFLTVLEEAANDNFCCYYFEEKRFPKFTNSIQ